MFFPEQCWLRLIGSNHQAGRWSDLEGPRQLHSGVWYLSGDSRKAGFSWDCGLQCQDVTVQHGSSVLPEREFSEPQVQTSSSWSLPPFGSQAASLSTCSSGRCHHRPARFKGNRYLVSTGGGPNLSVHL